MMGSINSGIGVLFKGNNDSDKNAANKQYDLEINRSGFCCDCTVWSYDFE